MTAIWGHFWEPVKPHHVCIQDAKNLISWDWQVAIQLAQHVVEVPRFAVYLARLSHPACHISVPLPLRLYVLCLLWISAVVTQIDEAGTPCEHQKGPICWLASCFEVDAELVVPAKAWQVPLRPGEWMRALQSRTTGSICDMWRQAHKDWFIWDSFSLGAALWVSKHGEDHDKRYEETAFSIGVLNTILNMTLPFLSLFIMTWIPAGK